LLGRVSNWHVEALDDVHENLGLGSRLQGHCLALLHDWLELATRDEHLVEEGQ
jgi:hypothetical protein